jgi:predicted lipoprotein with Yx(FWY)xxD motif
MLSIFPALRKAARTALMVAVPAVVLAAMLPTTAFAASWSGASYANGYHNASGRMEQMGGRRHGGMGYGGMNGRRSGYGNSFGGARYGQGNIYRSGYGNRSGAYHNTYGKSNYGSYGNMSYGRMGYGYRMRGSYGAHAYAYGNYGHGNYGYGNSGYGNSNYGSGYIVMGSYGNGSYSTGNYGTGNYKMVYPAQPAAQPGAVTLQLSSNDKLGEFLVGPNGMTLYTFDHDTPNQSTCTEGCAQAWPPLTVAAGAAPVAAQGISGQLGVTTRPDGTLQVTYNGRPLYFYAQDKRVGDTTGDGVEGIWHVAKP